MKYCKLIVLICIDFLCVSNIYHDIEYILVPCFSFFTWTYKDRALCTPNVASLSPFHQSCTLELLLPSNLFSNKESVWQLQSNFRSGVGKKTAWRSLIHHTNKKLIFTKNLNLIFAEFGIESRKLKSCLSTSAIAQISVICHGKLQQILYFFI